MLQGLKNVLYLHYCMHALLSAPGEVLFAVQPSPAAHSERILKNTIPPQQISSFRNKVLKHPQRRKQSILSLRRKESMLGYTTWHTYPSVGMWLFYILNSSQVTHCNLPELVHLSFALTSWETHTVAQESY